MTRLPLFVGAALPACLLASCAAVLSGGEDLVTVNSTVDGARILIDGELIGTNSVASPVRRGKKPHTLRIEHDAYLPIETVMETKFDPRSLLGILIDFGILTIPIDFLSGNAFGLSPTDYTVKVEDNRLVLDSAKARRERREAELAEQAKTAPTKSWSNDPYGGTLKK